VKRSDVDVTWGEEVPDAVSIMAVGTGTGTGTGTGIDYDGR
jgi:hypothetical protein